MTDRQTTRRAWLGHAVIGALSGAVGSVLTVFAISGHKGRQQQPPVVVALPSAATTAEIVEKAQAKMADRMTSAIVEGVKHD